MSKVKDVTLPDLDKMMTADVSDKEIRSELYRWSSGQLKLRRRQLVAAKRRLVRVSAKAIALSGRKALQLHQTHAEKVVLKLDGFVTKMEKINGALKP